MEVKAESHELGDHTQCQDCGTENGESTPVVRITVQFDKGGYALMDLCAFCCGRLSGAVPRVLTSYFFP